MDGMRVYSEGHEMLHIGDNGILSFPGVVSPSTKLHIVNTVSNPTITGSSAAGVNYWKGIPLIEAAPAVVHNPRRKQRCVSCGQMSWVDETITCPGCQSQVFECV